MAKTKATMPSDVAGHKVLTKDDNVIHDGLLRCTLQKIKAVVRPAILVSVIVGVCVGMQQAVLPFYHTACSINATYSIGLDCAGIYIYSTSVYMLAVGKE